MRVPHSQIPGKATPSAPFLFTQSLIFSINAGSRSVATTDFTPQSIAQNSERNPVPAPSSITRFPCTISRPAGVERNVPRCRAASHVLNPVVPEERISPRDSEVMTGFPVAGAVYLM